MSRPTLVSLAKELGVSRQTVSNVINAPHLVKAETRERVQAAIEASGYRPNVAAQALRSNRSMTLAMRIYPSADGIYGAVMDRFLHSLVGEARALGYYVMPITAEDDGDELEQLKNLFLRGSIDGCLLSGTSRGDNRPGELVSAGLAVVAFGRPWGDSAPQHFWVDVDGAGAAEDAFQALRRQGHERIGFLGLERGSGPGDDRRAGWSRATVAAGLSPEGLDSANPDRMDAGTAATEKLLQAGATGFVCATDSLALGAVEALRIGRAVEPNAAPLIGFDDSPVARAIGLSSVSQPVEAAVQLLLRELLNRCAADAAATTANEGVLLQGELQLRGALANQS